jgi:trimethylamine--corrinoid protein Co-methyltransferase
MQESVMSMLSAVHCGANFILHSAGFLDGLLSMSYEKFMMDADFCGALHSYLGGVTVDDNTLAMGAFHEVGARQPLPGQRPHDGQLHHRLLRLHDLRRHGPSKPGRRPARPTAPPAPTSAGRPRWPSTSRRRSTRAVDESLRDFIERKKAAMTDQWY